jgi:NADH dehydrogenase [ubiquinone] 1 alpha subcomplex assembly factor 1
MVTVRPHPLPFPGLLFRFDPPGGWAGWTAIDDPTMGGRSRSALLPTDRGGACFTGVVSLENGGGFCSVRSPDFPPVPAADAVVLRAFGDGHTYTVCLHTRHMPPGTSYRLKFTPRPGVWEDVTLPLEEFVLMRFGARAGVSPVDPARVVGLSLLISDRQEGPFVLELAHVGLVQTADGGNTNGE